MQGRAQKTAGEVPRRIPPVLHRKWGLYAFLAAFQLLCRDWRRAERATERVEMGVAERGRDTGTGSPTPVALSHSARWR